MGTPGKQPADFRWNEWLKLVFSASGKLLIWDMNCSKEFQSDFACRNLKFCCPEKQSRAPHLYSYGTKGSRKKRGISQMP